MLELCSMLLASIMPKIMPAESAKTYSEFAMATKTCRAAKPGADPGILKGGGGVRRNFLQKKKGGGGVQPLTREQFV